VTKGWRRSLVIGCALMSAPSLAHHSFAIYDMEQSIVFDGVVETLKMRNPHIAMTLTVTKGDGTQGTVNFIEGAPANMLVRRGLNPADIAVGKPIRAIGAPLHEDPNAFFLKAVILPDGRRFVFVGGE
jgi:hypothetical protein